MTTWHTSLAAAVVVQQLHGVVDGHEFLGSAPLALLPLRRLLESPVPLRLDEIALRARHLKGKVALPVEL